jgi:glycosyltransferase involved in cell wall biosynthesis
VSSVRRVLLVSHVFPPLVAGGAARAGQFARLLPDFGWEVTVLTARHASSVALDANAKGEIGNRARIIEAWSPASNLVRRGAPVHKRGWRGVLRRMARTAAFTVVFPDREVFWVPGAIRAGHKALEEEHHDAILATHAPPSDLIVGRALASAFKLPLVLDFRDLWSTLPMPVFPSALHRAAAHRVERSIVRAASRLVAVSPAMAHDLAREHGFPVEHAVAITNGFDPSDVARVFDDRQSEPRPFRLMYSGTVHIHYDLDPFWHALRSLADAGDVTPESFQVEFVGNLAAGDVEKYGLQSFVQVSPFVAHHEVFAALARADALFVVETAGYYARYGYAAKVFDYVLTGKPVLAIVDAGGNTATLLEQTGTGYLASPGDEAAIRHQLLELLKLKGRSPLTVDPDVPPLRNFNRRHLVSTLARVLDDAVTEQRNR